VRGLPLRFEMYSNLRSLSRGNNGPFSRGGINQSRVYRLALLYDDGTNSITVGRMIPGAIPSFGYVDGLMLSRRFGRFELGSLAGYQPDLALRWVANDFRKIGVFARYALEGPFTFSMSSAYARTYNHADLDREVVSTQVSAFNSAGLSVYANSEVDLRRKSGSELVLSPSLTSIYVNVNYRITRAVSVGVGGDAARPAFAFSSVRSIPDSLLERRLKSGANLNLNLTFPGGLTVSNTYTPRASKASFGKEYANYSSVGVYDIFSSGIGVRSNVTINSNAFTNSLGYGGSIQRNFADLFDLTLRYQRFGYTVRKTDQNEQSNTMGADLLVTLSRRLAVMTSYDRMEAFGTTSQSIFAELTVRF